jgi:3-deoxy-D-manno-octulosonate 8-phosphate phosphatase (KDO 8-P phosphatase)
MNAEEIQERLGKVKVLLLDVDGVMTDGRIIYDEFDDALKFFDCTDGLGIALLKKAGIPTVVISARKSKANTRRAKELGIRKIVQNSSDKHKTFFLVLKELGFRCEEACAIGDDLVDIPMLKRSGFAAAVQNAVPEVKRVAHYVTTRRGGRGAVREVAEMILKSQKKWEAVTREYYV